MFQVFFNTSQNYLIQKWNSLLFFSIHYKVYCFMESMSSTGWYLIAFVSTISFILLIYLGKEK